MIPLFNLLNEAWIPVYTLDGCLEEWSLRDVFQRAHLCKEVYDSSPVVTISLYRLMLAILYRCYRQDDSTFDQHWLALWNAQEFDNHGISAYFDRWEERFFLFHDEYPFYQVAGCEVVRKEKVGKQEVYTTNPDSILRIITEAPDGGGPTLFDHRLYTEPQNISLPIVARLLVASQGFGTSASQTGRVRVGKSEVIDPSGRMTGLCLNGATVWLEGDTLFETLMLNYADYFSPDVDAPPWEYDGIGQKMRDSWNLSHVPKGRVERLTWQGRMISLVQPDVAENRPAVNEIHYTQGEKYKQIIDDPMKVVVTTDKDSYVRMNREKASWRDIHSFLSLQENRKGRPAAAIRFVSNLIAYEDISNTLKHRLFSLNVAGLVNDKAKIFLWRHDRMTIPASLLNDEERVQELQNLIEQAEEWESGKGKGRQVGMAQQLRERFQQVCELYLSPNFRDREGKPNPGGRKPDSKDIDHLTDALDPRRAYWARLETHFQALLLDIADDPAGASKRWLDAVEMEACCAFDEAINGLGDSIRAQQAVARVFTGFRVASRRTQKT